MEITPDGSPTSGPPGPALEPGAPGMKGPSRARLRSQDGPEHPPGPYLHLGLLPGIQADGLDLADLRDVAVDGRAAQADEHAQGVGGPVGIWKAKARVWSSGEQGGGHSWEPQPEGPPSGLGRPICAGQLVGRLSPGEQQPPDTPAALGPELPSPRVNTASRGGH